MSSARNPPQPRFGNLPSAVAVAGIVLSPYATTWLRFRDALVLQAILVLGFTLVPIIGWSLTRRPRVPLTAAPAPVNLGIVLYASAATLGTLVALLRGNEPTLIVGQALSMALLPMGFIASQTVGSAYRRVVLVRALASSTVIASVVHFAYWAYRLQIGFPQDRLYLPNAVSMAGLVLMALLLSAAAVLDSDGRCRSLAVATAAVLSVYLVGTGTRSLWAAAVLGIATFLALEVMVGPRSRSLRLTVVAVAALALFGGASILLTTRIPCESIFPQEAFNRPFWQTPHNGEVVVTGQGESIELVLPPRPGTGRARDNISSPAVLEERRLLLASADAHGTGDGSARIDFVFSSGSGHARRIVSFPIRAEGGWVTNDKLVHRVPDDADFVHVAVVREPADSAKWRLRRVRLKHYWTRLPTPLAFQLISLSRRLFGPWERPPSENTMHSASLDYRVQETERLVNLLSESTPSERMIGHGLGARFDYEARSYDSLGERVLIKNPNYIHNFYAFLLFKLGVVGTFLVVGSIGLWFGWAVRCLVRVRGTGELHWAAAYIAIWLAYLAWALFCPELIDFRVAPIVGFFIGSLGTFDAQARDGETSPGP